MGKCIECENANWKNNRLLEPCYEYWRIENPDRAIEIDFGCEYFINRAVIKKTSKETHKQFELRILKNYEKTLSKACRKRTDNATLVHNILLRDTSTAGRTSCCDKCRELGVDPYSHSVN